MQPAYSVITNIESLLHLDVKKYPANKEIITVLKNRIEMLM